MGKVTLFPTDTRWTGTFTEPPYTQHTHFTVCPILLQEPLCTTIKSTLHLSPQIQVPLGAMLLEKSGTKPAQGPA